MLKSKSDMETFLELALISAICFVLGFVLYYDGTETQLQNEAQVENFDEYPLTAWQTTDKDGGECVKVKYRVQKQKTRLYMYNSFGKKVHTQPISLSPHKDGRDRVETYVWKLYRTEWTDKIPPGEYLIIVGTDYDKSQSRNLTIEIDIS
tara:strand:- start:217 stop:666 length:450 start_codon:yes stop_codon:yes gene_type:complete